MNKGNLIVYTSDLHGNENQYSRLFSFAEQKKVDTIIIGGDLFSSITCQKETYVSQQKDFLKHLSTKLMPRFKKKSPQTQIYLMPGNDDSKELNEMMEEFPNQFKQLHMKRYALPNTRYDIAGYSFVPVSPFPFKDWELPDTQDDMGPLEGVISAGDSLIKSKILPKTSIERDLKSSEFYFNSYNTLYFFHAPPYNTALDLTKKIEHVGSKAIRRFIEENSPPMTFHGHIHESVDMSERHIDRIGNTFCFSAGNDHRSKKLAVILMDIKDPDLSERILI